VKTKEIPLVLVFSFLLYDFLVCVQAQTRIALMKFYSYLLFRNSLRENHFLYLPNKVFQCGSRLSRSSRFYSYSPIRLLFSAGPLLSVNSTLDISNRLSHSSESVSTPLREKSKEAKIGNVSRTGNTKRWFKKVEVQPTKIGDEDGWLVLIDGRIIKTPKDNRLIVPTKQLALAVAAEWDNCTEFVRSKLMPLMTLVTTTIDIIPERRLAAIDSLLSYLKTDVACCRSKDKILSRAQENTHDPLIHWFSEHFKVPPLHISYTLGAIPQPEETLSSVQWMLFHLDDFTLCGLESLAFCTRSLVISTAIWKRRLSFEDGLFLSRLEEEKQIRECGEVKGFHDVDLMDLRVRMNSASLMLHLLPLHSNASFQK